MKSNQLYPEVFRSSMVALSPFYDFRLFKGTGLESHAHNRCQESRRGILTQHLQL